MSRDAKRVLIVDDNHDVLEAIAIFVDTIGHIAECAASGPAALERLEAAQFDVVLTDLLMQGMSGLELAREIKKRSPALPVVLMSVNVTRSHPVDVAKVLSKPFTLAELSDAIGEVC